MRKSEISRKTNETDIKIIMDIDGTGNSNISTGNGFFDHMLVSFAKHSGFDLEVHCIGDTFVDFHHSAEDIGIVMGKLLDETLGDKKGIRRFGNAYVPLDEALVSATVDISGRAFLVDNFELPAEKVGDFETELLVEFLRAFAYNSKITLHINMMYGKNTHHIIEAMFKSVARALKEAVKIEGEDIPSTKGVI